MTDNHHNIWSAILKTASSSKRIRTKNVLILGDACSGKSTLAHYLKHQPTTKVKTNNHHPVNNNPNNDHEQHNEQQPQEEEQATFIRTVASGGYVKSVKQDLDAETTKILGVGYTSALVHNQKDQAILRLGIYQLGHEQLLSLLDPVLTDDNLFGIIVLDWTKPWSFLESLQRWMSVLKRWSAQVITDESKARVKEYLQKHNQSNDDNRNAQRSNGEKDMMHDVFTINLGIPIAVVCCKSDAQKMLEEKYGYDEAQLDYIQQTLRCICMKYGAGLFYTSTLYPSTFDTLRTYIAHQSEEDLLTTQNNDSMMKTMIQPHFVESSCVTIPARWDTWEKIKSLEESYQCQEMDKAWEQGQQEGEENKKVIAALAIYHEAVPEPILESSDQNIQPTVTSEDEQILYARFFQSSNVMRPPPPPPLSTTFLRELAQRESTTTPASNSNSSNNNSASPKENYGSTSSSRRIEIPTAGSHSSMMTTTTIATTPPPAVAVYTTATATGNSSSNMMPNSIAYTPSNHVIMNNNNNNNNNATALMTYAASTSSSTTFDQHHSNSHDIGITLPSSPPPPSSEILSQFFQKLLYKNMESTSSSTTNVGGDDRRSRSSAIVDTSS